MKDYFFLENLTIVKTYPNRGLLLTKGRGVFLYDNKDNQYLDLGSNYGVNILGYHHPILNKFLTEQINKLINLHGSFSNETRAQAAYLIKKKTEELLGASYKVIFASSGSEAVDNAVKIGLYLSKRKKIIAFTDAYHGKTFLSVAITDSQKYKKGIPSLLEKYIVRVKFNDIIDLEQKFQNDVGVVVLELIQGDGGINIVDKLFVEKIFEIAKKKKAIVIIDEIQTGIGRTGKFFASEFFKVTPEILLLGKGLAGGIPASAILIKNNLADQLYQGLQTSTFGGNPLAAAGILAVFETINDKFLDNVNDTGYYFFNKLKKLRSKIIKNVRGKGLMIGVQVREDLRDKILKEMQTNKIIALPARNDVVRFLPPLILTKKILDQHFEKIVKSFLKFDNV